MLPLHPRHCTLCGPQAEKRLQYAAHFAADDLSPQIFSARRGPDRKHFRLMRCCECAMIFSDPACDPARLGELYAASEVTYGAQEEQIYQSYAPVLEHACRLSPRRRCFVEVGGGSGFMLRFGQRQGFAEQLEIEPSHQAAERFAERGTPGKFIRGMFDEKTLPPNSASLICFFQVLDHFADPRGFLTAVFSALEPGGVAVAITHNTQAMSARLLGRRSPIFDIEHTYLFNLQNIAQLLRAVGFVQVESRPIANAYSARYWADMLPTGQAMRRGVQHLLRRLHLADVPLRLRAGNMAAFAIKPPVDDEVQAPTPRRSR